MNTLLWEVLKDVTHWGQTQKPARTDEVSSINGAEKVLNFRSSPDFICEWFVDWMTVALSLQLVRRCRRSGVKWYTISFSFPDAIGPINIPDIIDYMLPASVSVLSGLLQKLKYSWSRSHALCRATGVLTMWQERCRQSGTPIFQTISA